MNYLFLFLLKVERPVAERGLRELHADAVGGRAVPGVEAVGGVLHGRPGGRAQVGLAAQLPPHPGNPIAIPIVILFVFSFSS